jgi:hypothetical protein
LKPILEKDVLGWFPPLAVADVALGKICCIACLKRQDSSHVFVVPRLLMHRWLKQLWKACDVVLVIPPGTPAWPANMFEPLLIGICFPFLRFKPWQFHGTPKMFYVVQDLCCLFKVPGMDAGPFLCKFWKNCHRMRAMQEDVVSRMLYFISVGDILHSTEGRRGNAKSQKTKMHLREQGREMASWSSSSVIGVSSERITSIHLTLDMPRIH